MKMTAFRLANAAWEANQPINRQWLKNILHDATAKEKRDWARKVVEPFADSCCSKQLIGRAATLVLQWAEREI